MRSPCRSSEPMGTVMSGSVYGFSGAQRSGRPGTGRGGSWAWPFCLGRWLWLCGLGLASLLGLLSLLRAALILLSWGVVAPLACSYPLGSLAECCEILPWPERPTSLSLLASRDLAIQCLSNASTLLACPSKHGLQWT